MSLTLWSGVNPENARTHKLLAAAALANVAVTLKACEYGRENETAGVLPQLQPVRPLPRAADGGGLRVRVQRHPAPHRAP
ncbi:hypothetical protein TcYC6_0015320 [Trypanosoma cruzi]|nr:hypothetical protein TcYC6_0015320 [Trypanosoma cruzi]